MTLFQQRLEQEEGLKHLEKDINNVNKYRNFCVQQRRVSNLLDFAEKEFYKTALSDNIYDYKQVFNICNNLLGRNQDLPLPHSQSNKTLADEFNTGLARR